MELEDSLSKALCYVYMGQQTGNMGLLKTDLESYERTILQRSGTADELAGLNLVFEFSHTNRNRYGDYSPEKELVFLKASIEGSKKASEILLEIAETSLLGERLKSIPERVLLFLIKYELLKMEGRCPVPPTNWRPWWPDNYIKDTFDVQKGMFNCLFLVKSARARAWL
jgi:hypothetical protein